MTGSARTELLTWLIDLAAAAVASGAAALCLVWLGQATAAPLAGGGVLLLSFSLLRAVPPEPGRYRLPVLELPRWTEVLAPEPLLPDRLVSGNVHLLQPRRGGPELVNGEQALAGSGEDNVVLLSADASAALRRSLAELRRSLA